MIQKSFTLIEILVVIAVLIIITAIAVPYFRFFQQETDFKNSTEETINTLRLAQSKTLASEGTSQWGIYFNNTDVPHRLTLFKGTNYISRDVSFDETHKLPISIEIFGINLSGGGQEVVFDRLEGTTSQAGSISLRLKSDASKINAVNIEYSGRISSGTETEPVALPWKDSRHVHFDYNRFIDINSEKLILTFGDLVTREIIIVDNLKEGQIYWEGDVDVNGQTQKIKIHTHQLNNPNSQFCIHRDRIYNNESLKITISGDSSSFLVEYSEDGLITTKTSIYASEPEWQ